MRRLLIMLMLFALPLQISWAVVATYCQHENEVTSQHFGHHEHEHEQAKTDEEPKENSIALHTDCLTCHGLAAAILMPVADGLPFASLPKLYIANSYQLESVSPSPPEKPNWALAA